MPERQPRLLRENNPDFASFVLGGSHIRDLPTEGSGPGDQVLVALPWSYNDEPPRTYPVVYLCDGFWDFPLVWGMYSHLLTDKVVPEYILVGLGYGGKSPDVEALRRVDLSPPGPGTTTDSLRGSTGPGDYLARLKHKIIPFIEMEYGVDPAHRVLIGCSIGGVFAISALFREPRLFNAIIALSPTVRTHDDWLFRLEQEFTAADAGPVSRLLRRRPELPARLFMAAGGADNPALLDSIRRFDRQLDARGYRYFEKEFRLVDGEKHTALKPEGFNRGLRYAFKPLVEP